MAAPTLLPVTYLIFFTILSCFWGFWIVIGTVIRFLSAPRKFFACGNYSSLPKIAEDGSFGAHDYVNIETSDAGKLSIHYVANGKKGNPLMLLLHGFPECWYSWRYQLKEFSKTHWVVAIDTRGYGDSDKPVGIEHYTVNRLIDDTAAIITALGYEKCVLIGHDWGGIITWGMASKHPDMCEQVVVMNAPYPAAFTKHLQSNWKQLLASWYMFYFQIPYLPEIVLKSHDFSMLAATLLGKKAGVRNRDNFTKEDLLVFKHYFTSWEARNASHNYIRANLRYKIELPRVKVKVRTLLVWGTEDKFLTRELASKSLPYAENIELKFVEGASHWVQQDNPVLVNQYIRKFLEN